MDVEIFLQVIIIILGFYLAFFKSYFQEKGKNLATSEDVEKITKKVEGIKKEIAEELAVSKSKIDLLYNLELKQLTNENESLINFHKSFSVWFNKLTSSLNLIDDTDNNELKNKIKEYDETYHKVLNEFSILEIYCTDKDFMNMISDLKIKILKELSKNHPKTLLELQFNNEKNQETENLPFSAEKYAEFNKLREERKSIFDNLYEKNIEGLKNTIEDYKKYMIELQKRIKNKNYG